MGDHPQGAPFCGANLVGFLYYPIFHVSPARATPGKRAMGIQVTTNHGETLTIGMALLRHCFLLGSTLLLFLGHAAALFTAKRQTVHDLIVDSIVVDGTNEGEISVLGA